MSTSADIKHSPYWSIRMITLLINKAYDLHAHTTDAWFILPPPLSSKSNDTKETLPYPFITTLLQNESDIVTSEEFAANFYASRKAKTSVYNYCRTTFPSLGDNQIKEHGKLRYVMINFSKKPLSSNINLSKEDQNEWAVKIVQEHFGKRFILDSRITCRPSPSYEYSTDTLNYIYGYSPIINQPRRQLFDISPDLNIISSDDETMDDKKEAHLCVLTSTTPDHHSSQCVEIIKQFKDHELLVEIIQRTGGNENTYCFNQLKRGIFRFQQELLSMDKRRMALFKEMAITVIQAVFKMIHPLNNDNFLTVMEEVFKGVESTHTQHSKDILKHIKSQAPKDRRPQMSFLTKNRTRENVEAMLGQQISTYEWNQARKHAKYPGVGLPVPKVIHRRCRLSAESLLRFFDVLSDNVQRYAFGTKIIEMMSGELKTIESVRTTRQFQDIFVLYVQAVLSPGLENIIEHETDDDNPSQGLLESRLEKSQVQQDTHEILDEMNNQNLDQTKNQYCRSVAIARRVCIDCEPRHCCHQDFLVARSMGGLDITGNLDYVENEGIGHDVVVVDDDDDVDDDSNNAMEATLPSLNNSNTCQGKAFGLPCLKQKGHSGNHKYTTSKMISRRICLQILDRLTAGSIKSLAGLDDEDVEKGRNNFIRLRAIVDRLYALHPTSTSNKDRIILMIHESEAFHKSGFIDHIKDRSNTQFTCCCLHCGFYSKDDLIECHNIHEGVCSKCNQSFAIFPLIDEMLVAVKEVLADLDDELLMYEHQLKTCRQNLIDYRAHLVLKFDEKEAEKDQLLTLSDNQAIVIADWKMKILEAFHRETQVKFFGKRGTSLLGFMVISNDLVTYEMDGRRLKNVQFNFFITDDTTQDNTSVNAAKCILYQKFLPSHIKEVHFRADGAGCFSCNLTKICIINWELWTGVKEISNTQTPSGGGKTNLDGAFGVAQRRLKVCTNNGKN